MKKSFILSLSILLLALSFAACQKPEDGPVNPTPPEQEDTLVAENGDPIQLENFTITLGQSFEEQFSNPGFSGTLG